MDAMDTSLVIYTIFVLILFIGAFLLIEAIVDLLPRKRREKHEDLEGTVGILDGYISQKKHEEEITKIKYQIGKKVLGISMIAMSLFAFIDILVSISPNVESELINSAFEAFKLITMTVLGYVFGTNDSKK